MATVRRAYNKQDTRSAWLMLAPFLLFFLLFVLYPVFRTIYLSFTNNDMFTKSDWVGLKNYVRLFTKDTAFLKALKNTSVYALFSIAGLTTLGFLTAAAMNSPMRGTKWIRMLLIYPYATSMTAVAMVWLMLYDPLTGYLNKFLQMMGLVPKNWLYDESLALPCLIFVNIWKNIGYCMLIYLAGMQSIPDELYEAATVDGANERVKLLHITLPALRPVVFFVLVTTTVEAFKTFEQVQIMTRGDPVYATTTIVHQIYQRGFNEYKMGYASAMAVVLLVILLTLTMINYRLNSAND